MLILLGIGVLVWLVDPNGFKPTIEARVKEATGRDFRLTGDIELEFFPWLAVRTGAGSFGNAPGFGPDPMATWQSAQLGARLFPLIHGELEIDRVKLNGAVVRLVRHADGKANWQGIGSPAVNSGAPAAKSRYVTIDGVDFADSRLVYVDEAAARRIEIEALNLTTGAIVPDQPFTDTDIRGLLHMDGFAAAGVPFRLTVPRAELSKDYSSFDLKSFSVKFGELEGRGEISGKLGESTLLLGNFSSNVFDARALLAAVGIEAPKTTDPKALSRIGIETTWRFENGALGTTSKLRLDDTQISGYINRPAGENAVGEFGLHGDRLDLARYIPPTDPASKPFVLPTAELRALKFRGMLQLEEATLDDMEMKGVTLWLLLDERGLRSQGEGPEKS